MKQSKTARQIQQSAEILFAEQGFHHTTMRQITTAANVNLAAINYHFGSKQGLIESVAIRNLTPFVNYLKDAVCTSQYMYQGGTVTTEALLTLLMRALLQVHQTGAHTLAIFSRLVDLAYAADQEEIRGFLISHYHDDLQEFIALLRQDATPMSEDEFFWRLHFLLGSMIFTLNNYTVLSHGELAHHSSNIEIERVLHRMIPVLTAGFLARPEHSQVSLL